MFKKLLYGLCFFNLSAMLSEGKFLKQDEIEDFLKVRKGDAEATWDFISPMVELPEKSDFYTSDEDKPIERFNVKEYDSFEEREADDPVPIFGDPDEESKDLDIIRIIKERIYTTITLKTQKAIRAWYRLMEDKDKGIVAPVVYEPFCKTRHVVPEVPFIMYSIPLELRDPKKSSVFKHFYREMLYTDYIPNVRIIDYESILERIRPELKKEAGRLMESLMGDQRYLREVIISKWFNAQKPILVKMQVKSECEDFRPKTLFYKPSEIISSVFIEHFCNTLGCRENVYHQTLILALLLLDRLRFVIDDTEDVCYYTPDTNTISLNFSKGFLSRRSIYHELNHALHDYLGIEGAFFETDEKYNALQRSLFFRKSEREVIFENFYKLQPDWSNELFGSERKLDMDKPIRLRNLYRALEIALLWGGNEELWNTVGFMQIGDTIYINRLSDVNFLWCPLIFHPAPVVFRNSDRTDSRFDDFIDKCCPALICFTWDYYYLQKFCYELEDARRQGGASVKSILPRKESFEMLLFLQNSDSKKIDRCDIERITGESLHPLWRSLKSH